MARQSILLPLHSFSSIFPRIFVDETVDNSNKVIKSSELQSESFVECIKFINSLSPDTQLVLNFISDGNPDICLKSASFSFVFIVINIENNLADGLLALLLSIEVRFIDFQFNWIRFKENFDGFEGWMEAFPFINFVIGIFTEENELIISNTLQLPRIGQVYRNPASFVSLYITALLVNTNYFLNFSNHITLVSTLKKEQVKGFLSSPSSVPLDSSKSILIPPKFQINLESEGILFEISLQPDHSALIFLDVSAKTLNFIDSVYIPFFKKNYLAMEPSKTLSKSPDSPRPNKWLDRSFSLCDWTNEDSMDEDSMKKNNKLVKSILSMYRFILSFRNLKS